ncbi:hypothetical protein [uncultured Microscilla sp.]|uniref:hypothetical protein n=1 Tax=uncultured Microscilla sp. TaxID=432653 RepID=UPI002601CCAC|nr:hypothetical protein [uncultured Microscilla sp.]
MISIQKLEQRYDLNPNDFDQTLVDYYQNSQRIRLIDPNDKTSNEPRYDAEKHKEIHVRLISFFDKIMAAASREAKNKEEYKYTFTEYDEIIPKYGILLEEQELEITIGLFRDLFVTYEIQFANHIKYMNDNFYLKLFELGNIGKFRFHEEKLSISSLRETNKHLFNKRGNFYKLFRNYFLTQVEQKYTSKLGIITIELDTRKKGKSLLPEYIWAIKILFEIHEMLWKAKIKYPIGLPENHFFAS